jgi:hypothetical protein
VGDDVPKNEKEEKQRRKRSFGWALIPTPLPYQGSEEEYYKKGELCIRGPRIKAHPRHNN